MNTSEQAELKYLCPLSVHLRARAQQQQHHRSNRQVSICATYTIHAVTRARDKCLTNRTNGVVSFFRSSIERVDASRQLCLRN